MLLAIYKTKISGFHPTSSLQLPRSQAYFQHPFSMTHALPYNYISELRTLFNLSTINFKFMLKNTCQKH